MQYTIIGAGRIGTTLASFASNTVLLRRGERGLAQSGPIIVCTRNRDLENVLANIPNHRREDLVFVQNGMLHSWLQSNGLEHCTQALLYFAVSKIGDDPVDGGGTVVKGKWADAFADLLSKGNLECVLIDEEGYLAQSAEKFLWNCVFGVLCQHFDCSVGVLCQQYQQETLNLIAELQAITATQLQITLDDGLAQRLIEYSLSIADYKGAVKEWPWRNGWLWNIEESPLHRKYLGDIIEQG